MSHADVEAMQTALWKSTNLGMKSVPVSMMNKSNYPGEYSGSACNNVSHPRLSRGSTEPLQDPTSHLQQHAVRAADQCRAYSVAVSLSKQSTQFAMSKQQCIIPSDVPVRVLESIGPDTNVVNLMGDIGPKLETELDIGQRWLRLVAAADHTEFMLHSTTVNKIQQKEGFESCARALLLHFSGLNMTVQNLTELLAKAELHSAMLLLRKPEPLRIIKQPEPHADLKEGETLILECEAIGFPRPQYQWSHYQNKTMKKVPFQTTNILHLQNISMDRAGSYVCQVYNDTKVDVLQSRWATVSVKEGPILKIIRETDRPKMTVCVGQHLHLECHAAGNPAPTYQWYRNQTLIRGCTHPILIILVRDLTYAGGYTCVVNNGSVRQSKPVYVDVVPPATIPPVYQRPNTVQAKVALLMGTETYTMHEALPAVRNDILMFEQHLVNMEFMVLTLLDLTKDELIQHVRWFCELLKEGVYGLFFYIGHGFSYNRQSFLIPCDAHVDFKPSQCVHLEKDVLKPILDRNPSMCLAMIDICRESCDSLPHMSDKERPEEVTLPAKGTTCIFYTTSPGHKSFENPDTKRGIFMTHLLKVIDERISVQELHTRVLSEIKKDPDAGERQYPIIESNLNNTYSLHDPVDYTGHTRTMDIRQMHWESAQVLPHKRTLSIPQFGFTIALYFKKQFSNAMTMTTSVVSMGSTTSYSFRVVDVPPEIKGNQIVLDNISEAAVPLTTLFSDLQRLKNSLHPTLLTELVVNGQRFQHKERLDLGEPLVASLHLNRLRPESAESDKVDGKT